MASFENGTDEVILNLSLQDLHLPLASQMLLTNSRARTAAFSVNAGL